MKQLDIRASSSRGSLSAGWLEARFSFAFGDYRNPEREHFSALRLLNEDWIRPGTGFAMHPHQDMEIMLMPLAGTVTHADSLGNQFDLQPDEVMLMRAGSGIEHSQTNQSPELMDHHLQIWLLPQHKGLAPAVEHRRFVRTARLGRWQLIASPDGQEQSLTLAQDARLWRAQIAAGDRLTHRGAHHRSMYLHVATGSGLLQVDGIAGKTRLDAGDAVAWQHGCHFEFASSAASEPELLLFDLPAHAN